MELNRLSELRSDGRGNLGRLLESISGEIRGSTPDTEAAAPARTPSNRAVCDRHSGDPRERHDALHHRTGPARLETDGGRQRPAARSHRVSTRSRETRW